MKKVRRIGCSFLMIMFMFSMLFVNPITAKADYTYRINIVLGGTGAENASFLTDLSSGLTVVSNGATVNISSDRSVITVSGLAYNDELIINPKSMVAIKSSEGSYSKYYVKGTRRSGADAVSTKSAFKVTQDDSYVIAYGVGSVVPYTVSYRDTTGTDLLASETFYAQEGEEIYIPYRYVSGYLPNAYNLHCKSLKVNQAFEFIYTKGTGGGIINESRTEYEDVSGGTSYITVDGEPEYVYQTIERPATEGTVNNRADNQTNQNQGAADGENQGADNQAGGDNSETIGDNETPTGVQDVIDIEDEEVAKGVDENAVLDNFKRYAIVLTVIGLLAILLVIISMVKYRRNE